MNEAVSAVEDKLKKRQQIKQKKVCDIYMHSCTDLSISAYTNTLSILIFRVVKEYD